MLPHISNIIQMKMVCNERRSFEKAVPQWWPKSVISCSLLPSSISSGVLLKFILQLASVFINDLSDVTWYILIKFTSNNQAEKDGKYAGKQD